jgi:hypothetical protein
MTFQIDVIPIKLDKGLFDGVDINRVIQNTLTSTAKSIKADFLVTVATWKNKPTFKIFGNKYVRIIRTDDQVYYWVNFGTKAHTIRAKSRGGLRFRGGYTAKTVVGQIMSRAGGSHGNLVKAQEVHHPGTKARKFDEAIGKKWERLSRLAFDRAIQSELT